MQCFLVFFACLFIFSGKSYGTEVDWMDSTSEEVALWEKMVNSPNTWIEATLPLRMLLIAKISKWTQSPLASPLNTINQVECGLENLTLWAEIFASYLLALMNATQGIKVNLQVLFGYKAQEI